MKIRLDQYLVQHGLIQSRERAKAMIMSGVVFVNEQKVDKAGEKIKEDAKVELRGHDIGNVFCCGKKQEKEMKRKHYEIEIHIKKNTDCHSHVFRNHHTGVFHFEHGTRFPAGCTSGGSGNYPGGAGA